MAYDSETNKVLAGKARDALNVAENSLQAAMRRLDELDRRLVVPPPMEAPVTPPPPFRWIKASDIKPVPRNFDTIHRSVFDTGMDGSNGNLQNGTTLCGATPRTAKPLSVLLTDTQDYAI